MMGRWIFIRDGRLARRTGIGLAVMALLVLILMFPLRVALGLAGASGLLSAREVVGTVWSGAAFGLRAGNLPLGDINVKLRALPLVLGRAEFALNRPALPSQSQFRAVARGGKGWVAVKEANGELGLAGMMSPLPVRALTFSDFAVEMRNDRCVSAQGRLGLVIPSLGPLLPTETVLAGPASCDGDMLFVPMQGPSGAERLNLTVEADGQWHADLQLTGMPVEVSAPLLDTGFAERPDGVGIRASGSF